MKCAIIGLGIIGAEWARHLHADGVLAACWNRTPKPELPLFEEDLSQLPKQAQILHICLADPAAVEGVLTILLPLLTSSHIIVQSSTIDPTSSNKFKNLVSF